MTGILKIVFYLTESKNANAKPSNQSIIFTNNRVINYYIK